MVNTVFSEKNIGSCTIPNRFVVPAMVTNYCTEDGKITERYMKYIVEKAKGGFGLIITEDYQVMEHGRGYQWIPGLYEDSQIEGNIKLTSEVHKHGSKIFCQVYHPGRQSSHGVNGNVQPIAPSAIKDPICMDLPKEMTVDEIKAVVEAFGSTAKRVKESGFDGIEIHCAHGYLLSEFLSPFINKRTDEYGGCFQNRVRIVKEVYEAVRTSVGEDFPVIVRMPANEYVTGGLTEADTFELARYFNQIGFDGIHITNSIYASEPKYFSIGTMFMPHAFNMETASQIKKLVDVPVIVTNRINDPEMADTLIAMGKADFVGMGRGSIADPHLPNKAKEGKFSLIRPCIGCLQGCAGMLFSGQAVTCLVNPRVGREYENDMTPAEVKKKVLVIGGGPAGLVAAETAALRGHEVVVYEKKQYLGGQWRAAAYPVGKGELATLTASLKASLDELKVEVKLGVEVTEEIIKAETPDAIIVATGANPVTPPIKGIDSKHVVNAEDILVGNVDIANGPVVVCGGGEVGGETAQFITQVNRNVTILEMQPEILNDMMMVNKVCLLELMEKSRINVVTGAKVSEILEDGVSYEKDGETITVPAVQVVSAFGYRANNTLEELAKKACDEVYVIGGAIKAGNAVTATKEGYEAGLAI